jgi:phenylpropionate dioxygenase-like ring-hydroxylating dioxygenase large terminal subunit
MSANTEAALAKVPYRITDPERIPTERYFDPEFFELERKHLWPKVWQMAARLEEIPNVGDYVEYTILDKSVIVVRAESGVKAFLNACRHRGVRLANGPGNCSKNGLVCPFHGWRWNAEGENTFVFGPHIFNEDLLKHAEIDLVPVRCELWAGCAFINLDDNARPLLESMGPIVERLNARHVDRLKMDWWYATVLPTNWKLAMEAFMEGYHVMQTHPQLHWVSPRANARWGPEADGTMRNESLTGDEAWEMGIDFWKSLNQGMAGMLHDTEMAVIEKYRGEGFKGTQDEAFMTMTGRAMVDIRDDALARGADMFDIPKVSAEVEMNAVEFMFPHYFVLPSMGAMSSYRCRPLTPETCYFEIWSLVIRPESEEYDTPTKATFLEYNSPDYPEIPRQDYSNLPLQQLGLHNMKEMRLSRDWEGLISNYQRLIDGYIAGLDDDKLVTGQNRVNHGYDRPICDIGF